MVKLTREKIAILLLILLLFIAGFFVYSYIKFARSFNHVATQINEARGELDGYKVIAVIGNDEHISEPLHNSVPPTDLNKAILGYENKGAEVFVLDLNDDTVLNNQFTILDKQHRVAIANTLAKPKLAYQRIENQSASINVALCNYKDDVKILKAFNDEESQLDISPDAFNYEGFDVVLTQNESLIRDACVKDDDLFLVSVPYANWTKFLIVSPNNFINEVLIFTGQ